MGIFDFFKKKKDACEHEDGKKTTNDEKAQSTSQTTK